MAAALGTVNPFRYRGYAYDGGDGGFSCPVYGRSGSHREREACVFHPDAGAG